MRWQLRGQLGLQSSEDLSVAVGSAPVMVLPTALGWRPQFLTIMDLAS